MNKMLKFADELENKYFAENNEYHRMQDVSEKISKVMHSAALISYTYDHNWMVAPNGDFKFYLTVGNDPEQHNDNPRRHEKNVSDKNLAYMILDFVEEVKEQFPTLSFNLEKVVDKYDQKIEREITLTIPKADWNA